MLRKWIVVVALGLLLVPAAAQANFEQGDWSLRLGGSGTSDNDLDANTFSVEGTLGYFFSDELALEVDQGLALADIGDDSTWSASTRVGLDYYFDLDNVRPFVGASIGYLYGDDVDEQFIAGPEAGAAFFVNSTTFIFASVEYQFFFEDSDDADDAFDDGRFVYGLGIGFRW